MNATNRNILLGIVVLVVLGVGIFVTVTPGKGSVATSTATTTVQNVFDPNATTSQTITTPTGTYTITPVTSAPSSAPKAPDYKAPVVFSTQTDASLQSAINTQLAQTRAVIAKDPTNFDAWVNLGVLHKMGGDYEGAATIWRYVTEIYPRSTVGYDDLGGLYMDFIKNYAKAEANFKYSISLDPHDTHAYASLVDLYTTYGYKTKADAIALVNSGLVKYPNDAELLQLKARLNTQ